MNPGGNSLLRQFVPMLLQDNFHLRTDHSNWAAIAASLRQLYDFRQTRFLPVYQISCRHKLPSQVSKQPVTLGRREHSLKCQPPAATIRVLRLPWGALAANCPPPVKGVWYQARQPLASGSGSDGNRCVCPRREENSEDAVTKEKQVYSFSSSSSISLIVPHSRGSGCGPSRMPAISGSSSPLI
jgi:hypothetical protein